MISIRITMVILLLVLFGCGGGVDTSENTSQSDTSKLTESEYSSLSPEQKYAVSNRLLSTLYKGVTAKEFFDLNKGIDVLSLKNGGNYLASVESALSTPLSDKETYTGRIEEKYNFDTSIKPKQYPLAMIFEFPLSKELFDSWMAYRLANTILFSPAEELDSADYTDIQRVYYRLTNMIGEDKTIGEIVYSHMISQENWRRFRSPEDNTREMLEIYLKKFNDEDVPKAAIACKNWYLSDESQGYQLMYDFSENTKPMELFDTVVVSCNDFYNAVSKHKSLIPSTVSTLVDVFFATYDSNKKKAITEQILATNPTTFRHIFLNILFSREYLINNERPKTFEETFFNIAGRVDWYANVSFFQYLNRPSTMYSSIERLSDMKQDSMSYKLGRFPTVPLDSLSFSYYHKSVRSRLLIDRKTDQFNIWDGGWQASFIDVPLNGDNFIQYLFLSILSRKATPKEMDAIKNALAAQGYNNDKKKIEQAMVVMDYISRLSELYTFNGLK